MSDMPTDYGDVSSDAPAVDGSADGSAEETPVVDGAAEADPDVPALDGSADGSAEETPVIDGAAEADPDVPALDGSADGSAEETPEEQTSDQSPREQVSVEDLQTSLGRDTLWIDDNKQRGRDYEALRDANIRGNFPVIDDMDEETGTATSIKTLDTRLNSYQDVNVLNSTIKGYIDKLSNFTDTTWHVDGEERTVLEENIEQRVLELAIPQGGLSDEQRSALQELRSYAEDKNVTLDINEVP